MAIQRSEAIVLKTQPFRSTSLIITFFTESFGKVRGLAKGVREERQSRPALYEIFTRLEIVFYEKTRSDLHLVSEASLVEAYGPLRSQLEAIAYASYFVELVDQLTEVHDPHPRVFELLDFCFRYLSSLSGEKVARLFEIKLLQEIGWLPYLSKCLICGAAPLEEGFFSPRQGALLCPKCARQQHDATRLPADTLAAMRYLAGHDAEACLRFSAAPRTQKELEAVLGSFLMERLGRALNSQKFLQRIRRPERV